MSSHKFTTWLEIPVEITFDYDPPQREITAPAESAQPPLPPVVDVTSINVKGWSDLPVIDIRESLACAEDSGPYDAVIDACWDHMEKINDRY